MTEKELLYIDDILGHITNMEEFLDIYACTLEDDKMNNCLESLCKLNKDAYKKFYKSISE
ncbi:MAG TPA: hypothetical protein DCY94_03705 [Firmicutes bacterium]|nr:hypothetical protein [Bacillota bacterium]